MSGNCEQLGSHITRVRDKSRRWVYVTVVPFGMPSGMAQGGVWNSLYFTILARIFDAPWGWVTRASRGPIPLFWRRVARERLPTEEAALVRAKEMCAEIWKGTLG